MLFGDGAVVYTCCLHDIYLLNNLPVKILFFIYLIIIAPSSVMKKSVLIYKIVIWFSVFLCPCLY